MDPVNNSPTNSSPASGAAPSTPQAVNPLQPTQAQGTSPVAGAVSASVPPVSPVTPGVPQMPNMTETLNMVAAESATQAPSVPGVAQGVNATVDNTVSGVAGPAPVNPTASPATEPVGQEINTVQDEVVETLSIASEGEKPVPVTPIARPTNIDGINSARTPKMSVSAMSGRAATTNPFVNTTDKQTPSVSFTDPMTEPEKNASEPVATPIAASKKKKSSKTVLIVLSVIAFLAAIALAAVLVMELMGVGPFATNNNSGQTSGQSQDSSSTNGSSSNSGNSSGVSSNSGTNSTNSGGTGTSTNIASGSIVCNATITEDDITMDSEVIFNVTNNKIASVTMNAVATDAQGNQEEMSETRTFEEMVDGGEMSGYNEYIDSDGTLKVTAQEFAGYIEENLDLGGGSISCEVK